MCISLLGILVLAVAGVMVVGGLHVVFRCGSMKLNDKELPYTGDSIRECARYMGMALVTAGLGIACDVLLRNVLFSIGPVGFTVGLMAFIFSMVMANQMRKQGMRCLMEKLTVIDCGARISSDDDQDHSDSDMAA